MKAEDKQLIESPESVVCRTEYSSLVHLSVSQQLAGSF